MSSDPVGSLAEEAAKLVGVFQRWGNDHDHEPSPDEPCRFCPICSAVRLARSTPPDVREHLADAAVSLGMALKGLMEPPAPPRDEPPDDDRADTSDMTED